MGFSFGKKKPATRVEEVQPPELQAPAPAPKLLTTEEKVDKILAALAIISQNQDATYTQMNTNDKAIFDAVTDLKQTLLALAEQEQQEEAPKKAKK